MGVVFVLMAAAELARGLRPRRAAVGIALVVAVAAVAGNLLALRDAYNDLRALTPVVRGDLAGLEIAADRVDPALVLDRANSGFDYFTLLDAGSYLSASEKFGSPAYDQSELAAAPRPAGRPPTRCWGRRSGCASTAPRSPRPRRRCAARSTAARR